MQSANGFDKLAKVYAVLEYASFGPMLWRARTRFLPNVLQVRHALVLGDGDGRFTAALLRRNQRVQVVAVDASAAMLAHLQQRVMAQGDGSRLRIVHADAASLELDGTYDLVCTHFFLDCLSDEQVRSLAQRCAKHLRSGGLWMISEFAVPKGWVRLPAATLIQLLYLAFRGIADLQTQQLPDYAAALQASGLTCKGVRCRLFGVLRSELWQMSERSLPASNPL